ncbi:MAG: hypothetical protein RIT45_2061 [Pseudomonadota bacterium]
MSLADAAEPHWLVTADCDSQQLTPVMRQVLEAKRAHPDAVVFFRLGDFYELFFEDALLIAPLLDMVLTSRNKKDARPIPMCGFPHFGLDGHLERLVAAGLRVAVVEQLEDPKRARGIVKRGVTRVITPGVVLEQQALDGRTSYHLLAVAAHGRGEVGVAVAEVSTGALQAGVLPHGASLDAMLARLEVRELLLTPNLGGWVDQAPCAAGLPRTVRELEPAARGASVAAADRAVSLLRAYLAEVRPGVLGLLGAPQALDALPTLTLGAETVAHLELLRGNRSGGREGTLLEAVDRTASVAGGRLLRGLLLAPLADREAVQQRHEAVQALLGDRERRTALRAFLRGANDLARTAGRALARLCVPRELAAMRDTLLGLPALREALAPVGTAPRLAALLAMLDRADGVAAELATTLADEPRNQLADGGVIRPGFDPELDALVSLADDGESWAMAYQEQLRESLGLPALKVRHNRMSGWGIEISRTRADAVPDSLRRVQTLKHVERYVTPELADFDARLQTAAADRQALEIRLWNALCASVGAQAEALRQVGAALAELDVHAGFAELAAQHAYVRPELHDAEALELVAARHPVVEQALPHGGFVANDVALDAEGVRVLLLTGPNMAGKSTLMRQVALCCVLAQAGGFVPADAARLPILRRVLTRIGASDDLAGGASTFMVEMRETAAILRDADAGTLVLLDEVGRGTSTEDGLAIARAVVEHLHDRSRALVLFATHYHELTALEGSLEHLANAHVTVREVGDDVVFVHTLAPGPTSRSHGVSVARLAGLPSRVLQRARELLELGAVRATSAAATPRQLGLFTPPAPKPDPRRAALLAELAELDVDALSPRVALERLYALRDAARALERLENWTGHGVE